MLNKPEFQMAIHAVTRKYTSGACRNSRNLMRLPPCCKMRPDSHAFRAEQFQVQNQTRKDLKFLEGTPENPQEHCPKMRRTLMSPQECKIGLVYPISNQDKANFPFIGFIAIPRSASNISSGLTSFRKIQRFPETPMSSLEEHQFQ